MLALSTYPLPAMPDNTENTPRCSLPLWHPARIIATVFYVGHMPFAPGTWGSLAAFPITFGYVIFLDSINTEYVLPGTLIGWLILLLLGWKATKIYLVHSTDKDPKEVVIDEVIGQQVTLWLCLPVFAIPHGHDHYPFAVGIAAFIFFRWFDIKKPGRVGWADKQPGAKGVMLDDIIAGVYAAPCTYLALLLTVMVTEAIF